jgi:histidyl-tRNA synthetase
MSQSNSDKARARLPRGFRDRSAADLAAERRMLDCIRGVFESYGFDALETPVIEFAEALGKFLPDQDRPNEGVFALRDDDEQWISLRYDLTAPLARYVAEHFDRLPKPFRRYQTGPVFRNEKPGPGRFREFTQFDADTVGTASMLADAEGAMILCDAFEALGLSGQYVVKVNNRKVLNGVLESIGLPPGAEGNVQRLTVLRAIDKLDRLGPRGVQALLGDGRKDESGDFTKGAGLKPAAIERVMAFTSAADKDRGTVCSRFRDLAGATEDGGRGVAELVEIDAILTSAGYGADRVSFDPSIVRGLEYYTGPVIEAEATFEVQNEDGLAVRIGSIASGGRYDDLVKRFTGQEVPATGVSIGVSRLLAALAARELPGNSVQAGPVVVLVMDRDAIGGYLAMAGELRAAGVRAEIYTGTAGMKAQLKYADKRQAPFAIIEGGDERAKGVVTIKDLALGADRAKEIKNREDWAKGAEAQISVPRGELVARIKTMLARK